MVKSLITCCLFLIAFICSYSQSNTVIDLQKISKLGSKVKKHYKARKLADPLFRFQINRDEYTFRNDNSISSRTWASHSGLSRASFGEFYLSNDTMLTVENYYGNALKSDLLSIQKISNDEKQLADKFEIILIGENTDHWEVKSIIWKKRPQYFNQTKSSSYSEKGYQEMTSAPILVKKLILYSEKYDKALRLEIDENWRPKKYSYKIRLWNRKNIITIGENGIQVEEWDFKNEEYRPINSFKYVGPEKYRYNFPSTD